MRSIFLTLLLLLGLSGAQAAVVRPAPDFTFLAAGDKARSLKSLRGQSVILVITDSAKSGAFKKQLKNLQEIYQQFASKGAVIVVAMPATEGTIPTNMPLALASDGASVASAYGTTKGFQIAIIGRDGNLDYQTGKVLPSERVRDIVQNSYAIQESARKQ